MDSRHIIRGRNTKKQGTKGFMRYRKYFNDSGFIFSRKCIQKLIEFHMHLKVMFSKKATENDKIFTVGLTLT